VAAARIKNKVISLDLQEIKQSAAIYSFDSNEMFSNAELQPGPNTGPARLDCQQLRSRAGPGSGSMKMPSQLTS
jgi:hypothetical protein